ncbi:MAG: hypothetical protein ABEH59_01190 [Halobacteriales archaeon]
MPTVWRPAFLAALLVVLAGCTAIGFGPGSPTPTPTATPAWPDELPPGLTTAKVSDSLDLARAHTAGLSGKSFTYRATITARSTEGLRLGTVRIERRVAPDGRFVHRMRVDGVVPSTVATVRAVDAYSDGSVVLIRFRKEGRNRTLETALAESPIQPYDVIQKGPLYSMLSATEPEVIRPLRRGGVTYLHLKGANGSTQFGLTEASNMTFQALVAPNGVVHRYAVRYHAVETDYAAWEGRIERTVLYEDIGTTTVEQPSWAPEERANATEVPTGR